jgi:hypothetical protein
MTISDAPWYCIRTERARERAVAESIAALGFPAWVPMALRFTRDRKAGGVRRTWDSPVAPTWLFAAVPVAVHGDFWKIRGYVALERDSALDPVSVAPKAIAIFRAETDARYGATARHVERLRRGIRSRPPPKLKVTSLADLGEAYERFRHEIEQADRHP